MTFFSFEEASARYEMLRRFRDAAKSTGPITSEDQVLAAFAQLPPEMVEDIRPSFSVSISTQHSAGRVETPVTKSLQQALNWRHQLLVGKSLNWESFRLAWVNVLTDEREGSAGRVSRQEAEQRVDAIAAQRSQLRCQRANGRLEAQSAETATRHGTSEPPFPRRGNFPSKGFPNKSRTKAAIRLQRSAARAAQQIGTVVARLGRLLGDLGAPT